MLLSSVKMLLPLQAQPTWQDNCPPHAKILCWGSPVLGLPRITEVMASALEVPLQGSPASFSFTGPLS